MTSTQVSKNRPEKEKIIFLNQVTGNLFKELCEDLAQHFGNSILLTGNSAQIKVGEKNLLVYPAPMYVRKGILTRIFSGINYFINALFFCWSRFRETRLFIVSNPFFLGLIGVFLKKLRGQGYAVLVYDIYPNLLISLGKLKKNSLISRIWRKLNKIIWENAEVVFTIGNAMRDNISASFDCSKTKTGKVIVIPNWTDTNIFKPIAREKNPFAQQYGLVDKLTVLYSGNLGNTHDIETILEASNKLRPQRDLHFLIIGEGSKRQLVEKFIAETTPENLTLLPWQDEAIFPYSLACGDIAIITLAKGIEGLSFPSKTSFSLAAGSALIGLVEKNSEVAELITSHDCGLVVSPGDIDGLEMAIKSMQSRSSLTRFKNNALSAAQCDFSRKNTRFYIETLQDIWR